MSNSLHLLAFVFYVATLMCSTGAEVQGYCGCGPDSCSDTVLDSIADGHSCRDRIEWVMANKDETEVDACRIVSEEYPSICGGQKCHPDQCNSDEVPNQPDGEITCGCGDTCTSEALENDADGHSCKARIQWVMDNRAYSETGACCRVSEEFPSICGPSCHPELCDSGSNNDEEEQIQCGCPDSCTEQVLGSAADGHTCLERIEWVLEHREYTELEACQRVSEEYPIVCGVGCHPDYCGKPWEPELPPPGVSLSVVTQNLWWWRLFGELGGGDFFEVFARYGTYDIIMLQECEDVNHIRDGLEEEYGDTDNAIQHQTYQTYGHDNCIGFLWDEDRFDLLDQGHVDVGEDKRGQPKYCGMRPLGWVRLFDKDSGRNIFLANHHGPLPKDTGGETGGKAVASAIASEINKHKEPDDFVVLGGDFNSRIGSTTMNELQYRYGYQLQGSDSVDHILTLGDGGIAASPEVVIIDGTGSDHSGVKTTWKSF